jgi:ribonucleoside-diphosphate reductase alpha chain
MLEKYKDKGIDEEINWAYDMMFKKKVLGSQRALQFGGDAILKKNCRIFNCSASYCDRPRVFQESFHILLCGTGSGLSIQKHHVNKLPKLRKHEDNLVVYNYRIGDCIEKWSDALGVLLYSYFEEFPENKYSGLKINFIYDDIRPKGSYLSSSSGRAPGPEPLREALEKIRKLLDRCIQNKQERLKPIDCCDIACYTSDAVLSGGVRRSATILLFSPDDEEMLKAKTGNWFIENPQRARSNNSVILKRDEVTFEQFNSVMQNVKEFGEPGFLFVDDKETLCNACSEISFYCYDKKGNSGWGFCNLSTINCGSIKDKEDFYDRCKSAAIIGSLQANFTNFEYLGKITEDIVRREALLGVSMTGIMEKSDLIFAPGIQKRGAQIIKETNKYIAEKIGINQAARTTCCKPEGSTSCLLGTSSGIHPQHAKRYLRRIQNNNIEAPYQFFKIYNQQATEKSQWGASGTDENIIFPIEVPDGSKLKNQIPAIDMLKIIKDTQKNWINEGKNEELCIKPWLNHAVSNTCIVKDDEWNDVIKYVYKNREYFAGVTFLSDKGDKIINKLHLQVFLQVMK